MGRVDYNICLETENDINEVVKTRVTTGQSSFIFMAKGCCPDLELRVRQWRRRSTSAKVELRWLMIGQRPLWICKRSWRWRRGEGVTEEE